MELEPIFQGFLCTIQGMDQFSEIRTKYFPFINCWKLISGPANFLDLDYFILISTLNKPKMSHLLETFFSGPVLINMRYAQHFRMSTQTELCFISAWTIWCSTNLKITKSVYSAHVSLQTKLSDNMKCCKSQGQVNYCYSQILLKHIITFNISMFQNLCTIKSLYAGWD